MHRGYGQQVEERIEAALAALVIIVPFFLLFLLGGIAFLPSILASKRLILLSCGLAMILLSCVLAGLVSLRRGEERFDQLQWGADPNQRAQAAEARRWGFASVCLLVGLGYLLFRSMVQREAIIVYGLPLLCFVTAFSLIRRMRNHGS